jgi:hypothetical protein
MTPKEKAQELLDKYWIYLRAGLLYDEEAKDDAKHCALIAVDEIMKAVGWKKMKLWVDRDNYWEEVKQEIEKL